MSGVAVADSAQRHASWLLVLIAVVNLFALEANPDSRPTILTASAVALVCACGLLFWPMAFVGTYRSVVLIVGVILAFGVSTWVSGERAAMTGPGFVLAFVWIGAYQPVRVVVMSAPLAGVTYGLALASAGSPPEEAGSAVALVPIATLVGVVISQSMGQLRSAKEHIGAQDRWRAAMLATLAHDVRSPLTTIVGALEIVAEGPGTPKDYLPLLAGATRQADRISRLATGLLQSERIEHGRLRLDHASVDLAALVGQLAAEHPASAVRVDVPPHLTVTADPERLEQILVNLINNALRHGDPPVFVSAGSDNDAMEITIRDSGPGVPAADVPSLFERFSSADRAPQSAGLGLWIVRMLTEAHGGVVTYRPGPTGAEFVVRFPLRHEGSMR